MLRMENGRVLKQLLYGELGRGERRSGAKKLYYKDVVKQNLKATDIDVDRWEELATDLKRWRHSLHEGRQTVQIKYFASFNLRHYQRHNQGCQTCPTCGKNVPNRSMGAPTPKNFAHKPILVIFRNERLYGMENFKYVCTTMFTNK